VESLYQIEVPKLALGRHSFDWKVGSELFAAYPESEVQGADVDLMLSLEKTNRYISVQFQFSGMITLQCDRCLQAFEWPLAFSHQMYFSFEKSLKEAEEAEVVYVPQNIIHLNLQQDIYDLISLQVPYRKVPEACEQEVCRPEVARYLSGEPAAGETLIDPRWEKLAALHGASSDDSFTHLDTDIEEQALS
jgi:uncharacterized protein